MPVRRIPAGYIAKELSPGKWVVVSPAGTRYDVNLNTGECSCPYFSNRRAICKHILYVEDLMQRISEALDKNISTDYNNISRGKL